MKLFKSRNKRNMRPTSDIINNDGVRNAASTLLANIRFMEVDKPIRSIVVTSSVPNEGKSSVSMSLACAIAEAGLKVLLVEADLRRRSLANALDVSPKYGLHSVLTGEHTKEEAIAATEIEGVSFLNAETGILAPEGLFGSKRFTAFMADLAGDFDYVIYDTPPLAAFADAAVLGAKADGVVVVVREGSTDRRVLALAMEQLRAADANVLGVAVNGLEESHASSYGYGYYYNYYYEEVSADDPRAKEQKK